MANENEKVKLTIEFDSDAAAKHFASWLDGQGEQDYWIWMECREQKESGNITALSFNWDYKNFSPENLIRTKCGRLDAKWNK
jgi:hypothetical protein